MESTIKVLSFDMDGTLITKDFDNKIWFEGIPKVYAEEKGISFERAREEVINKYYALSRETVEWYDVRYWLKEFELKKGWEELFEKYKDEIRTYPEVEGFLSLASKKFKLAIITNATREFLNFKLERTKIGKYFSHTFSATSDFRRPKKGGKIFTKACKIMKIKSSELLHIGDEPSFDCEFPTSVGVNAILIDREGRFARAEKEVRETEGRDIEGEREERIPKCKIIRDLTELKAILKIS